MKNILVFDKSYYFRRFIKSNIKDLNFLKYNKKMLKDRETFTSIDGVIFVTYDNSEIVDFLSFYEMQKPTLVCSNSNKLLDSYSNISNVECFDINTTKRELIRSFEHKINWVLS